MATAQIDLTCDEVIVEDLIEPFAGDESEESRLNWGNSDGKQLQWKKSLGKVYGESKVGHDNASQVSEGYFITTEKYKDPLHTLLPTEIRWIVLKYVNQSQLLTCRAVSHAWKNTIDAILRVNVKIDGSDNEFRGKCSLPMKSCQLVALQNPAHRHLFSASSPDEVSITRGICHVNFKELILQWSNLSQLELCWKTFMKNLLFGKMSKDYSAVNVKHLFPNLLILKIELLTNDRLGERTKKRILSNITMITSYRYPSLEQCSMSFVGYRELHAENRYLSILLPFLGRHAETLDTIDFSLKYASHVNYPPVHPRHILFCVPANYKSKRKAPNMASDGKLITTRLKKFGQSVEDNFEWIDMLNNRRKLEVAIMTRFLNWSIKHLDFFKPTVNEYCRFLRCLELMNITMYDSGAHNTVSILDAKIFSQCPQLVHLHLYRAPIIFHEDEDEPTVEMINFHNLPRSLQEVVVDGLPISSDEILLAVTDLNNLQNFQYFQSQVPRRNMLWTNGINWEVLQCILRHPTLINVKVHATSFEHVRSQYEQSLKDLCLHFGWYPAEILPGYMNLYQISLSRSISN